MSILKLNDGTELEVLETSTPNAINISGDLTAVTTALDKITTDNMKNADLAGTIITNKIYETFNGSKQGDVYNITFTFRDKTDIEVLYEMADETQQAIIELASQG